MTDTQSWPASGSEPSSYLTVKLFAFARTKQWRFIILGWEGRAISGSSMRPDGVLDIYRSICQLRYRAQFKSHWTKAQLKSYCYSSISVSYLDYILAFYKKTKYISFAKWWKNKQRENKQRNTHRQEPMLSPFLQHPNSNSAPFLIPSTPQTLLD